MIDRAWLVERGFVGFLSVAQLRASGLVEAPPFPGVYAVLRESTEAPEFLPRSPGGHFKGRDPSVPVGTLDASWVPESRVVYIGKAGHANRCPSVRRRLKQYLEFGEDRPVGHWGGRYIWQLADSGQLLIAWRQTNGVEPRAIERKLIEDFRDETGRLPFANLRR